MRYILKPISKQKRNWNSYYKRSCNENGKTENGDKKAANFIKNELSKSGAKLLGNNGFQSVNFPINSILDLKLSLSNTGDSLQIGKDYLVFGSSPTTKIELKNIKPLIFNNKKIESIGEELCNYII